jgi:oligopeptidase B
MPEQAYEIWGESNALFDTEVYRFGYSSMVTPASTFEWNVADQTRTLLKEEPVLGNYDPAAYVTRRLWATAGDGTQVPVTIVHRKDLPIDGSAPLIMTGYGSYGVPYDPYFTVTRLPLLDRGVVFALAHIRGGGDLGRAWYEAGKFLNKQTTFDDFISVSEFLVTQGYAAPDRLAIYGGSAGGLLMGAVANQRPELFAGIVAQVPFVDVVTTMMDETIPLTVIEWEEWGDPHDKLFFDAMLAYSPYDNVVAQDYPPMLITSGLNDPRVQYWEPTKWTAQLRAHKTDGNVLLLKTNMGAGHGGASGLYGYLEDKAFLWAFLLESVEVTE